MKNTKSTKFTCSKKTLWIYTPFFLFWIFWWVPEGKGTCPNTNQSHCIRCPKFPATDSRKKRPLQSPQDPTLARICSSKRQGSPKTWFKAMWYRRGSTALIVLWLSQQGIVGAQDLEHGRPEKQEAGLARRGCVRALLAFLNLEVPFLPVTQTRTPQLKSTLGYSISFQSNNLCIFPQKAFSHFSIHRKFSVLISSGNKNPIFSYFQCICQAQRQEKLDGIYHPKKCQF